MEHYFIFDILHAKIEIGIIWRCHVNDGGSVTSRVLSCKPEWQRKRLYHFYDKNMMLFFSFNNFGTLGLYEGICICKWNENCFHFLVECSISVISFYKIYQPPIQPSHIQSLNATFSNIVTPWMTPLINCYLRWNHQRAQTFTKHGKIAMETNMVSWKQTQLKAP